MRFPCEEISKIVIPAIRALIVKELNEKYGKNQIEIATLMDLTQPSVSYYLRGERGGKGAAIIKESKHYQTILELTEKIVNNSTSEVELFDMVCGLCHELRETFIKKLGLLKTNPHSKT